MPLNRYATTNITRVANPAYQVTGVPPYRCYSDRKSLSRLRKRPCSGGRLVAKPDAHGDHSPRSGASQRNSARAHRRTRRHQVVDEDDIRTAQAVRLGTERPFQIHQALISSQGGLRTSLPNLHESARFERKIPVPGESARDLLRLVEPAAQPRTTVHRHRNHDAYALRDGEIRESRHHRRREPRRDASAARKLEQVNQNQHSLVGDEDRIDARQRVP